MARRVRLLLVVLALGGVAPATVQAAYVEVAPAAARPTITVASRVRCGTLAIVLAGDGDDSAAASAVAPAAASPAARASYVLRRWLRNSVLLV